MCDLNRSGLFVCNNKFHLPLQGDLSALRIFLYGYWSLHGLTLAEITSAYLNKGHTGLLRGDRESVSTWMRAEKNL